MLPLKVRQTGWQPQGVHAAKPFPHHPPSLEDHRGIVSRNSEESHNLAWANAKSAGRELLCRLSQKNLAFRDLCRDVARVRGFRAAGRESSAAPRPGHLAGA